MDLTTKKLLIPVQSKQIILLLFFFLLLTTGAIIFTTWQNLRSVRAVADRSIQNLAMALSLSVENSLRSRKNPTYDDISRIFSDRIVAYAFIADRDGRIIYHTNPLLVGSIAESKGQIDTLFHSQVPIGHRTTLRTGIPVYQFRYILRLAKGRDEVLELVLNRSASDKVVTEAEQIWWTVAAILTGFWTIGFILAWTLIRYTGLQEELEERKRMALIGQMTAVLTHEIRNAVGGIKGFTQWVDEKTHPDDTRKTGLEMIIKGTNRVEDLVNNLLMYSREETYTSTEFNLTALIHEVTDARKTGWKGNIIVTGNTEVTIRADREKLERVFLNGFRNAIEAMGDSGELMVSVTDKRQTITISIEDTGPGIPKADLSRIFTPFFTTKTNGTGLGLAYSRKIIEGMGGQIDLQNRADRLGAILTINLPKRRKTA